MRQRADSSRQPATSPGKESPAVWLLLLLSFASNFFSVGVNVCALLALQILSFVKLLLVRLT